MPPSSWRASSSKSSRTRSSSSPRRATSRTCRPAPRRSTSPTASTPTSGTAPSAPRPTTGWCRSTTSSATATSWRSSPPRPRTAPRATGSTIVQTSAAREKIRQWFKRQQRDENISQGKDLLDRELRRLAHETLGSISTDKLTRDRVAGSLQGAGRLLRRHRLWGGLAGERGIQAGGPRRRRHRPARGGAALRGPVDHRRARQGRGRPAGAVRELLLTDPGRRDHRLRDPRQGRDHPPRQLPVGAVRAGHRAADRRRLGVGRPADLPDHGADRGARPARAS